MTTEMKYTLSRTVIILQKGTYQGYSYFIINTGWHPCAYVCVPKGHKYYKKSYDSIPIDCHGGLTFADKDFNYNPIVIKDHWWIGWDYGHYGDYTMLVTEDSKSTRWTTEIIYKEVQDVIKQLRKIK